jgi:hypothetical protein
MAQKTLLPFAVSQFPPELSRSRSKTMFFTKTFSGPRTQPKHVRENAQKDVCLKSRFCFTNNAHTKASQLGLPRWKDWWLSEERRQILHAVAAAEPSPPAETAGDETAGDETAGESRRVRVGYISRYAKPVVLSHLCIYDCDLFAKTGSGQTHENTQKRRPRFLSGGSKTTRGLT